MVFLGCLGLLLLGVAAGLTVWIPILIFKYFELAWAIGAFVIFALYAISFWAQVISDVFLRR